MVIVVNGPRIAMSGGQVEVDAEDVDWQMGLDGDPGRGASIAADTPVGSGKLGGPLELLAAQVRG